MILSLLSSPYGTQNKGFALGSDRAPITDAQSRCRLTESCSAPADVLELASGFLWKFDPRPDWLADRSITHRSGVIVGRTARGRGRTFQCTKCITPEPFDIVPAAALGRVVVIVTDATHRMSMRFEQFLLERERCPVFLVEQRGEQCAYTSQASAKHRQ